MITRVPVSISMGTRGTRELLMSLLVEALIQTGNVIVVTERRSPRSAIDGFRAALNNDIKKRSATRAEPPMSTAQLIS